MFDVTTIVQNGGLLLLGIFLFAEVGLFLGFFLPGDTLLIAAGIYAHEGKMAGGVGAVILVATIAAIAGDNLAYYIGRKTGPRVFRKDDSLLFRKDHILKAEAFYEKHGPKTLLISHFLPVVRTFTPLLAGVARMPYRKFLLFNAIGDTFWAVTVTLVGYYIGSRIPNVDNYILAILAFVIAFTLLPTVYHVARMHIQKRSKKS